MSMGLSQVSHNRGEREARLPDQGVSVPPIPLIGSGPFHLPACAEEIGIRADPEMALIQFTTVQGQTVGVPVPTFALRNLAAALLSAKDQVEASSRPSEVPASEAPQTSSTDESTRPRSETVRTKRASLAERIARFVPTSK
jgi:hypothetical protein